MSKIRILSRASSEKARANERGKLFERLMADTLRHLGYQIDHIPSVNYAGIEIDIEGQHSVTQIPLYAECKFYEGDVGSPKLQQFLGKFTSRWLKDKRSHGLFIAIPGLNPHAKGFYRESLESQSELTLRLLEEEHVVEFLFDTEQLLRPSAFSSQIEKTVGAPGDSLIAYTAQGLYFVQFVVPTGTGIATAYAVFTPDGGSVRDRETLDFIREGCPELVGFQALTFQAERPPPKRREPLSQDEVVEVQGSSEWFEYQFPAAPQFFVGRDEALDQFDTFLNNLRAGETSARGLAFEANSGWGKSSLVLTVVDRLRKAGHFGVALDCRSANSTQFLLRAVDHVLRQCGDFDGLLLPIHNPLPLTGLDGAGNALLEVSDALSTDSRFLFIFFDQFENIFYRTDILKTIRNLFLKLASHGAHIVFGFAWKTDLIGLTSEFPYQLRDCLRDGSFRIPLGTFAESETSQLLERLSQELHAKLRKDLQFLLAEVSQGYPWLLKKLCAHVKAQRAAKVTQRQIAEGFLNVEELFEEDLRGLSANEEEALRSIAHIVPISVNELESAEFFTPDILRVLVHRRLLVRIGTKYDLYWDIFRDFLKTQSLPAQANFIPRVMPGGVLRAAKMLADAGGEMDAAQFIQRAGKTVASSSNVLRDLRLLGLLSIDRKKAYLRVAASGEALEFEDSIRPHIREHLRRNRLVVKVLEALQEAKQVGREELPRILKETCPYVSATSTTWQTYAKIVAAWMDFSDLAFLDRNTWSLSHSVPGQEVRERRVVSHGRRSPYLIGMVQYRPIEVGIIRVLDALRGKRPIDWSGVKRSTRSKVLASLVELGFVSRDGNRIRVSPQAIEFVDHPERRAEIFARMARQLNGFTTFLEILQGREAEPCSDEQLGHELAQHLGAGWTKETAKVNAKIMLNWARHARLAPQSFVGPRSKRVRL